MRALSRHCGVVCFAQVVLARLNGQASEDTLFLCRELLQALAPAASLVTAGLVFRGLIKAASAGVDDGRLRVSTLRQDDVISRIVAKMDSFGE